MYWKFESSTQLLRVEEVKRLFYKGEHFNIRCRSVYILFLQLVTKCIRFIRRSCINMDPQCTCCQHSQLHELGLRACICSRKKTSSISSPQFTSDRRQTLARIICCFYGGEHSSFRIDIYECNQQVQPLSFSLTELAMSMSSVP